MSPKKSPKRVQRVQKGIALKKKKHLSSSSEALCLYQEVSSKIRYSNWDIRNIAGRFKDFFHREEVRSSNADCSSFASFAEMN